MFLTHRPWLNLASLFAVWKILLLVIVLSCPGPGYDTSTQILLSGLSGATANTTQSSDPNFALLNRAAEKLTRWDGIYFVALADRGHVFEQEWAFSWACTRLMNLLSKGLFPVSSIAIVAHALSGILLSNLSHLLAVIVLYELVLIVAVERLDTSRIAFTSAVLHIISPAGLFLSAPVGESLFALLSFAGMLWYAYSLRCGSSLRSELGVVLSGLAFGAATMVRGNGLLFGTIFAVDMARLAMSLATRLPTMSDVRRIAAIATAGLLVAAGFIAPQAIAYGEYCTASSETVRPQWCSRTFPSIYSWVQYHYWNVGFLRYWTLSNLPLFLLATPAIYLMLSTALASLLDFSPGAVAHRKSRRATSSTIPTPHSLNKHVMHQLAIPQALLAVMALTNFHVQIITRLASGYPLWYISVASAIVTRQTTAGSVKPTWVTRWMVMYGIIQGGLFASFLPPA